MTRQEYMRAHQRLAHEYSVGLITFEGMKKKIKELDDHAHEYQLNAYGEKVCWCGASE